MTKTSVAILFLGSFLFILSIINATTVDSLTPSLQRAQVLACVSSIVLAGIGTLWLRIEPKTAKKVSLIGEQGIFIDNTISDTTRKELAWGSHQILTATAASTVLIYWKDKTILKRGLISADTFTPGKVTTNVIQKNKLIILGNTNNYPESIEFDSILENLPSVLISPIEGNGAIIVGGWSIRCFTKSDEIWISGWANKISEMLIT